MAIIGYEPGQNGGYRFRKDDGSAQTFFGPEAESLKAWVDQTRRPDARLAENDMPPPETQEQLTARLAARAKSDLAGYKPAAAVEADDKAKAAAWNAQFDAQGNRIAPGAPPPAIAAPVAPAQNDMLNPDGSLKEPGTFGAPPPSIARPAAPSGPVIPKGIPVPMSTAENDAKYAETVRRAHGGPGGIAPPHPSAQLPPMIPPTGGASPAASSALADQLTAGQPRPSGGAAPKMVLAEQTLEGAQRTPEEAARIAKMLETRQAADDASLAEIKAVSDAKTAAYEQQSADAADAALDAHDRQLRAQDQAATVEQAWNKTYAGLQQEQQAAANQKIDPKRLYSGENGTLNTITSALAVGLGAFGGALLGGPNYAHQIIQASIDRDINAQADQIHARRGQADNALGNFMRVHGLDVNEAKLAVRAIGQEYAGNLAQIRANQIGSLDAKQKAAELQMKLGGESAKNWADLATAVKQRETDKFKMAGGGGGKNWDIVKDPNTGKSYVRNLSTGLLMQEIGGGDVFNVGGKPKGGNGPGKLSARLGATESVNEAAQEDLTTLEKADPGGWIGLPMGAKHIYRTDAQIALEAPAKAFASKFIAANGEPLTEAAQAEMVSGLTDRNPDVRKATREAIGHGARTYHKSIERQRGNVEQGVGPEQEGSQ